MRLTAGELPPGVYGRYWRGNNAVVIADRLLTEDSRPVAAVLAHELVQAQQQAEGIPTDCVLKEVDAIQAQALAWSMLWGGAPPTGAALERRLTRLAELNDAEGVTGLYAYVVDNDLYREKCGL